MKLLRLLFFLALALPVAAQTGPGNVRPPDNATRMINAVTANGSAAQPLNTRIFGAVKLTITISGTATVNFEGRIDVSQSFGARRGVKESDTANTTITSTTTSGDYIVYLAGDEEFNPRVSGCSSCTVTVWARPIPSIGKAIYQDGDGGGGGITGVTATSPIASSGGATPDISCSTCLTTADKDATGGYAGLTLFKIDFKNAANTFTSFFTNSNSAARTYIFQNRDGTIADDTDLAAKQNTITFGTGVQAALAVNIGSAGAPVLNGGAGGTPSSVTLTNGTGYVFANLASKPTTLSGYGITDAEAPLTFSSPLSRSVNAISFDLSVANTFSTSQTFNPSAADALGIMSTGTSSTNNAALTVLKLTYLPTGASAAGAGPAIAFSGKTTTTTNRPMGEIDAIWTNATQGSQNSDLVFKTTSNAILGEAARITSAGNITATLFNGLAITSNGTNALNIAAGKTLTLSDNVTLASDGTGTRTLNIGAGGTLGSNAFNSTAYAPLASPTFTGTVVIPTPFTIGAVSMTATGTQLNYLNAATGTTGTASTSVVFSTSPSLVTPVLGAATATSINGNTFTTGTYTLTGVAGKTLTFNKSLTLDGTDSTTMTFPSTSATVARTDAAQTFTGTQTFTTVSLGGNNTLSNGLYAVASGNYGFAYGSTDALADHLLLGSARFIYWCSTDAYNGTRDTTLSRQGPGVVQFGTTTNNAAGSWLATNGTLSGNLIVNGATSVVRLKGYTVATLPSATQGDTAFCTDLLAPAFLTTAVGGGSTVGMVFYNGSAWVTP